MSNPGGVNFNLSPYYDDYDEDDKFVRILFRPGRAVQARELTQIQTILQKQVQRFGNYFFKEGSIIDGCEQGLDLNLSYVKLNPQYNSNTVNVYSFLDKEIIGANTGIVAKVGLVNDLEGTDPKTLYINYVSSGLAVFTVNAIPGTLVTGSTVTQPTSNVVGKIEYFDTDLLKVFVSSSNNISELDLSAGNNIIRTVGSDSANIFMEVTDADETNIDKRLSKKFEDGEVLFTKLSPRYYANTASSEATTKTVDGITYDRASKITIGDGVVYIADHFVKHSDQTIILDKYTNKPSYKIGVIPQKTVVDYLQNEDLVDNALGTPNYQAPGADRFKINTILTKLELDASTANTEFITLLEVENGLTKKKKSFALENKLEDVISKRTFEESGDYTLTNPKITIREHLVQGSNGGRYTISEGGNTNLLLMEVDPFISYVKGYRNEFVTKQNIEVDKGLDIQEIDQSKTQISYGNYVDVKELLGSWDIMEATKIDLYDSPFQALSGKTFSVQPTSGQTKVGEARVRAVEYVSGTPGTPTAVYRIHLFDVKMITGTFESVRSLYDPAGSSSQVERKADIILDSSGRAILQESSFNTLVYKLPYDAIRRLRDAQNNIENAFNFKKTFPISITGGQATISSGDNNETFVGSGNLSSTQKNLNYYLIVDNSNTTVYTTALTGTVSVSAGTKIVTGSGTTFTTRLNVGELIEIGAQTHRIESIANNVSLTLETNHTAGASGVTHRKVYPSGTYISLSGNGGDASSKVLQVQTGATSILLNLNETFTTTFTAKFVASLNRVNAREMKKVLQANSSVIINANTHPNGFAGPYSLGQADVYKIKAIYQSTGFGVTPTTSNTVVTSNYTLDNGQRDSTYEHGTITPINSSLQTGQLLVVFDYFTHDTTQGIGYLSVDSYPIDDVNETATTINTADLPKYTSSTSGIVYNLRDCIDFRLRKTANTAAINPLETDSFQVDGRGLHIPKSVSDFDADLSVYKGRVSKLFLNEKGEFGVVNGSPGYPIPQTPSSIPGTLDLAIITIPPYPSAPQDVVIEPQKNRRYTMKDIGKIEDRVNRLEYYTSLNLIEKQTTDISILDENGLSRFKNGILVEPYVGHNIADVNNSSLKSSISRREKFATAQIDLNQVSLKYNSIGSSNVVKTKGNKVFLTYDNEVFSENPYASSQLNLAQPLSYDFVGMLSVYPSTDNWFDENNNINKSIVTDLEGTSDNWRTISNAWETEYDSWQTRWVGVPVQQDSAFSNKSVGRVVDSTSAKQYDVISSSVTVGPTETQSQTKVVDISVNHYMRSRDYIFSVSGLKPNSRLYATFDGVPVTSYCKQVSLQSNNTIQNLFDLYSSDGTVSSNTSVYQVTTIGTLYSDNKGEINGIFSLPADTFTIGQREFKLSDDSLNRDSFITTLAKNNILSQGLTLVSTASHINTRPLNINLSASIEGSNVNRQVRTQENQNSIFRDPMSQSFFVDDVNYPYGIFLTKIDLYFKTKSSNPNRKVYLQIREMENGLPTKRVIGDSTVFLNSSNINVSSTGATASSFVFDNPIFLLAGNEYCFSVIPENNSDEFEVWIAELGQLDISSTDNQKRIDKQPAAGILFTSSNDFIWSVRQSQDIKYKMYVATFDTTSTGTAKFDNLPMATGKQYSALVPNLAALKPDRTSFNLDIDVVNSSGLLSGKFKVDNLERVQLNEVRNILTSSQETSFAVKSLNAYATLETQNKYISPFIDLERINSILIDYKINNLTSNTLSGTATYTNGSNTVTGSSTYFLTQITPGEYISFGGNYKKVISISSNTSLVVADNFNANGSSVTITSKNEENPNGPYVSESRYITRRVELADGFEANDLNVYVDVNRPAGSDIKVYYKVLNSSDNDSFDDKFYQEMTLEGTAVITNDSKRFVEEKYVVPESIKTGGELLLNGTVTIASASSTVTGASTRFLEELRIGDTVRVGSETKVISTIANNVSLTVDSNFSTSASGQNMSKLLYNALIYTTPDNRSYAGYKYLAVKVVFLSDNKSVVPKIKKLRAIALA